MHSLVFQLIKLEIPWWLHLIRKIIYQDSNSQGSTESPFYSSQILKDDLDDIKFPSSSTVLQYVDNFLLSPSQDSLQEDSIYLLKFLNLKRFKDAKEKIQFSQIQV